MGMIGARDPYELQKLAHRNKITQTKYSWNFYFCFCCFIFSSTDIKKTFYFNPYSLEPCFMILSAISSINCDYSSDVEFLKLIVIIDLFITNMEM